MQVFVLNSKEMGEMRPRALKDKFLGWREESEGSQKESMNWVNKNGGEGTLVPGKECQGEIQLPTCKIRVQYNSSLIR